jgi:hypothetical protein
VSRHANTLQLERAQVAAQRAEVGDIAEAAANRFFSPDDEEGESPFFVSLIPSG